MPIPADSHTTMNEGIHISAAPNDSADILALYRKMAERSPLPIAMTVGQTHLLCGANPAFSQLFGSQGVALLEQPLIDAVPAVDADCVLALLDQVYQTGEAILGFDQQPFHAQNNQISWSYSVWPIPDQQGRPIGLVIQIHDTTANHRDEQAAMDSRAINEQLLIAGLRESELAEQLQLQLAFTNAITNSLGEGLYVLDTAGRCTFVNPAAERMLGWTGTELQGRDISVVIPADAARGASSAAIPAPLQDILRFGTTQRSDNAMFVHRDGGVFPTAYSAAPIIMDKQIVGAVVAFRDMAEMRRLQRLREEYLALISHDLRSPLTVISGRAQLLVQQLARKGLEQEAQSATIKVFG